MSLPITLLGPVDYAPTAAAMQAFTEQRGPDTADALWICEHPPVYTQGLAGKADHILNPGSIPIVQTNRGGQVTYHGPGQVVAYPLVDLRRLGIYVKELVFRIEQATVQALAALGADGRRVKGAPGVYVPWPGGAGEFEGLAKIAALGIKVTRGCSYHGVSLNVAMDLAPYSRIDPCGYAGLRSIDLATLGLAVTPQQAAEVLAERLGTHLSS